jgi:hypothetical protein
MIRQSQIFDNQTIQTLKRFISQYTTIYGIKSVVDPTTIKKLKYCFRTKELLIPDFNVQGDYMACSGFALEAYRFFSKPEIKKMLPNIKSFAYVWGSDEVFTGHCILVLSPLKDLKLGNSDHSNNNCQSNSFVQWYLDGSLIYDICRKEVKDFKSSSFKAKSFFYGDLNLSATSTDGVFNYLPRVTPFWETLMDIVGVLF